MSRPLRKHLLLVLAVASSTLLTACYVVPVGRPHYAEQDVVTVAPPAPQYEVVTMAPGPGYFWIGGYWGWSGGRHVWNGGRWEAHRPGYAWEPHRWHRHGNGWRADGGRWQRR